MADAVPLDPVHAPQRGDELTSRASQMLCGSEAKEDVKPRVCACPLPSTLPTAAPWWGRVTIQEEARKDTGLEDSRA